MKAEQFYDVFGQKLVNDYTGGNRRMLAALQFMQDEIGAAKAVRVLDIGCGIGWSSHTLAKIRTVESVLAVDLSSQLLSKARTLFSQPKIRFEQLDVTKMDASKYGKFDAIVMLDVYEHIPKSLRPEFHAALNTLLTKSGLLLVTCPTVDHQCYLKSHNPSGLQPVDEDVGLEELAILAADLDSRLDHYKTQSIWAPRDYLHAVIRRNSGAPDRPASRNTHVNKWLRKAHVKLAGFRAFKTDVSSS